MSNRGSGDDGAKHERGGEAGRMVRAARAQQELLRRTWLAVALVLLEAADEAERNAGEFDS